LFKPQLTARALSVWLLLFALLTPPAAAQQATTTAVAPAAVAALTEEERAATARVRPETIRGVTEALSSKEMQGRGTGQPGGEAAARYIAEHFSRLGLKPLGDKNTFFQTIKFRETQLTPETFFQAGEDKLKLGDDYIVMPPSNGDEDVSARAVFVGYGISSAQLLRNDFKDIDVRGKVVVLLEGPPRNVDKKSWEKARASFTVMRNLVMAGAAALVVAGSGDERMPYATLADYLTRRQLEPSDSPKYPAELPPFIAVSDAGAERLFAGSALTYAQARDRAERGEYASQNLKLPVKIKVRFSETQVRGSNVVGLLEGSDPKLKQQAVVYSAHYDAYGVGADGRVYPGAADNALGVAEIIAIAEALAAARPRRSVIFLAVTGEEYGLHGTEYWIKHPTWDIKRVAANLNFDGMGTEIYGPLHNVVGFGAEHSDLGRVLEAVVAATGRSIIPDPEPEERTFVRSDHYAFVKRGVPALMMRGSPDLPREALTARVEEYKKKDYHQPSDVIKADWNWEGPVGVAQLGAVVGLRVANAEEMPAWLKTSPFNRKRGTDEPPPEEP
jgi:hypothetical protein